MSFTEEQLQAFCEIILNDRKILNGIIVLCEGKILKENSVRSPQSYKRSDMPDANFYRACIPRSWIFNRPVFFNCGNSNNVLNTYTRLQEMLTQDIKETVNQKKDNYLTIIQKKYLFLWI